MNDLLRDKITCSTTAVPRRLFHDGSHFDSQHNLLCKVIKLSVIPAVPGWDYVQGSQVQYAFILLRSRHTLLMTSCQIATSNEGPESILTVQLIRKDGNLSARFVCLGIQKLLLGMTYIFLLLDLMALIHESFRIEGLQLFFRNTGRLLLLVNLPLTHQR